MNIDLEIVYIKVPVVVKANRSNVEDVTNEIYGDAVFAGTHEQCQTWKIKNSISHKYKIGGD